MTASVETFPDTEFAARVASRFREALAPPMRLCLATGRTPSPVYEQVAVGTPLDGIEIFLLDEFGGLPRDDQGRCTSMLARDLLDRAEGHPVVHAPEVDAPAPDRAAGRYQQLIADGGIDLAILGLGSNGHIGMNEPGTTVEMGTRVVTLEPTTSENARGYGASVTPTWGITVGMAELMAAREIWVLVTGAAKTDILSRTLHGEVDSEVPATFLTEHPACTFFVDEAAFTGSG
ncbi:MAG TPA: glucosamine-6-phosphate deaminase [Acidimicrobiia bacterium]|nr:glucosamine-6-phosphate deaminase [Acidimicrobiia bacterium]